MWNAADYVLETFGIQNLARPEREMADTLEIPTVSKTFLTEVGLPVEPVLGCRFELRRFTPLREYAIERESLATPSPSLKRIGCAGDSELCLDEARNGRVISFDIEQRSPTRFVNHSLEMLGASLAYYVDVGERIPGSAPDVMSQRAAELEKFLRQRDPLAVGSPDRWWSIIIEKMKRGKI